MKTNWFKSTVLVSATALLVSGSWAMAQSNPGAEKRPPRQPLQLALDANGDGVIDAGEIANATAALKTLDKNGDGKLTADEYRPPRQEGRGGRNGERQQGGSPSTK